MIKIASYGENGASRLSKKPKPQNRDQKVCLIFLLIAILKGYLIKKGFEFELEVDLWKCRSKNKLVREKTKKSHQF